MHAMAHLDHKESTISSHYEWDVSKYPFHPPGIVKLDLIKSTEDRTRSIMRAADSTVPNSELTCGVYHCGERQKFITSTEASAAICGTNCALKLPKRHCCSKRSPVHIHTHLRALVREWACVCAESGDKTARKVKDSRRAPVPDDANALPRKWHIMAPSRRVPLVA
jgi:hypothetical protein